MTSLPRPLEAGLSDEMRVAVLENLSDGVYFVDRSRRILYWNKGAERITGFSAGEVVGHRCKDGILNHCDEAGTLLCGDGCPLLATIHDGQPREVRVFLHHKSGRLRPVCVRASALHDATGKVIGGVEVFHDDSALVDSRRRAEDLERASLLDPLTGAGNRRLGEATLAGWVDQYRRFERPFGLLFLDIDRFKAVNDRFGHDIGDQALQIVTGTIANVSCHGDEVIRWGGDEFVVLLGDADACSLRAVAERLRMAVKQSRLFAGQRRVPLSVSMGGTLVAPGDTIELMLARADGLMYGSKASGRDRVTLDIEAGAGCA